MAVSRPCFLPLKFGPTTGRNAQIVVVPRGRAKGSNDRLEPIRRRREMGVGKPGSVPYSDRPGDSNGGGR